MPKTINLTGKNILVIGASSGIGQKIAISSSEAGASVSIVARREDKLLSTLEAMPGENKRCYIADISCLQEISDVVRRVVRDNGKLDGVVYSAGITMDRPLRMNNPEIVETMFKTNFMGFYETVRIATMKNNCNEGMSIVGISSAASVRANKSQSIYSATKAAMDASVRVLAQEMAGKSIRINTIRPGMIRTEMYEKYQSNFGEAGSELLRKKQIMDVGETEDIANMALYLLSNLSKFITGTHISVDGGASAC